MCVCVCVCVRVRASCLRHWLFEQQQQKYMYYHHYHYRHHDQIQYHHYVLHLKSSSTPPSSTSNYRLCVDPPTCVCTFVVRHVCVCLLLTRRCRHHFISLLLPVRVLFNTTDCLAFCRLKVYIGSQRAPLNG